MIYYPFQAYSYQHFLDDAERLYDHFLDLRQTEPPEQLIERFRLLFIENSNYPNPEVSEVLCRLVTSRWALQEFGFVLNRCCYILINYWWFPAEWWLRSELRQATIDLVALFENLPPLFAGSFVDESLRELVRQFSQTTQFVELQRRARTAYDFNAHIYSHDQPIGNLIQRYPYLYPHCLLNGDSTETGHQVIKQMQTAMEDQFEQRLMRYTTFLLKRDSLSPVDECSTDLKNPTLLSDRQLKQALKHFAGTWERDRTQQELATELITHSKQAQSFRSVKGYLYDYLTAYMAQSPAPDYGNHHFNQWLSQQLETILPQSDHLRPSTSLLVQTCGRLINSLIADPDGAENHHVVFVDLNNNLGAMYTIGLLLKIVLLCREIKSNMELMRSHLAKQFAIVFSHYETKVRGQVEWLVECLEHLLVGFGVHYGRNDFSWIALT